MAKRKRATTPEAPRPDETPSRKSSIRKPASAVSNGLRGMSATPSKSSARRVAFYDDNDEEEEDDTETPRRKYDGPVTPSRRGRGANSFGDDNYEADPPIVTNANRSARRKSVKALINRTILGGDSGGEEEEEEEELERMIYDEEEVDEDEDESERDELTADNADTQAKQKQQKGKRKAGTTRRKQKEPSPPSVPLTEGFEAFFQQSRSRVKASASTVSLLPTMTPESYFAQLKEFQDHHADNMENLKSLHERNFQQWSFELSRGFNVLLYGYGSKKGLLMEFIKREAVGNNPVVVVNGYQSSLTLKDIFKTVTTVAAGQDHGRNLGSNPNDMLQSVLEILDTMATPSGSDANGHEPSSPQQTRKKGAAPKAKHMPSKKGASSPGESGHITLLIHSLDSTPLRNFQAQGILSRLASHPRIRLVASIDHIMAPYLWDSSTLSLFNFLFHDATTFAPYTLETSTADESESILDVLSGGGFGRGGKGGARGVKFVLASLPGNAKGLYRVLVANQLQAMEEDNAGKEKMGGEQYGIEFKTLYQKAMEEFLCSSDMAFRTLLKEFHDHHMITSRKDLQGTEVLWAPFRKDELDSILEEILLQADM